jgi:hypothetical protein
MSPHKKKKNEYIVFFFSDKETDRERETRGRYLSASAVYTSSKMLMADGRVTSGSSITSERDLRRWRRNMYICI